MRSLDFPQVLNLRTLLIPRVKLVNYPRFLQSSKAYLDFPLNQCTKILFCKDLFVTYLTFFVKTIKALIDVKLLQAEPA